MNSKSSVQHPLQRALDTQDRNEWDPARPQPGPAEPTQISYIKTNSYGSLQEIQCVLYKVTEAMLLFITQQKPNY